jgi:precorrin-2/cobalt-factor-2 C20-methyltransferase
MKGRLIGIGVGPGDPELLTLKAHRLLSAAAVVAYPAPDDGPSFARSVVAQYLRAGQIEIPIVVPMRAERHPARAVYDDAAAKIAAHLSAGLDVVVLCEGDPFFYGSFMYLHERLALRFAAEIVPGVSSLTAAAAMAGRPLAARNDALTVIPAPLPDERIEALLQQADSAVFIKLGRHLPRVVRLLEGAGLADHAIYAERVSLASQRILPLAALGDTAAPYFSMILLYKGAEDFVARLPLPEPAR